MEPISLTQGQGRTQINLQASFIGPDLIVCLFNSSGHIGAVAVGEYDFDHSRASVSVLTRLGHKDDALAQESAHTISKLIQKPVCVVAGVHLDDITLAEIKTIQKNARLLIDQFVKQLK